MGILKGCLYVLAGLLGLFGWSFWTSNESGQAMPVGGLLGLVFGGLAILVAVLGWVL